MPHIDYPTVIIESPEELREFEKRHRYSHLFQRARMLRLLKTDKCRNLGEAAPVIATGTAGGSFVATMLLRYWQAYSDLPPPEELRALLGGLFSADGLYLYAR